MPASKQPALEILGHAYGGHGGSPFDDRPQAESGPISQITLQAGLFVDAISVTYGNLITWHGGPGGSPQNLTLKPGEYITGVEGRAGMWIDYLKFTTNLGQTVEAGGQGGHSFSVPNPDGLALYAIAGRDGSFLDQIQFVFGPAPSAPKKTVAKKTTSPKAEASPKKVAAKKVAAPKKTTAPKPKPKAK